MKVGRSPKYHGFLKRSLAPGSGHTTLTCRRLNCRSEYQNVAPNLPRSFGPSFRVSQEPKMVDLVDIPNFRRNCRQRRVVFVANGCIQATSYDNAAQPCALPDRS